MVIKAGIAQVNASSIKRSNKAFNCDTIPTLNGGRSQRNLGSDRMMRALHRSERQQYSTVPSGCRSRGRVHARFLIASLRS